MALTDTVFTQYHSSLTTLNQIASGLHERAAARFETPIAPSGGASPVLGQLWRVLTFLKQYFYSRSKTDENYEFSPQDLRLVIADVGFQFWCCYPYGIWYLYHISDSHQWYL